MADEMLLNDSIEEIKGEFKQKKEVEKLILQVGKLEVLNQALWLLLEEKLNCTHEELNSKIDAVLKTKREDYFTDTVPCPNCGRNLQLQGSLRFNVVCIYCGHKTIVNPYQLPEKVEKTEVDSTEESTEYDVTKELNFEDIDN